jgi:hypothetical protein
MQQAAEVMSKCWAKTNSGNGPGQARKTLVVTLQANRWITSCVGHLAASLLVFVQRQPLLTKLLCMHAAAPAAAAAANTCLQCIEHSTCSKCAFTCQGSCLLPVEW